MVKRKSGRPLKEEAVNTQESTSSSATTASSNKRRKRDRISPVERHGMMKSDGNETTGTLVANGPTSKHRKSAVIEMKQLIISDQDAEVIPYSDVDHPTLSNLSSNKKERHRHNSKRENEDEKLIAQNMPFLVEAGWIYDENEHNYCISLQSSSFTLSRRTLLHNLEKANVMKKERLRKYNLKQSSENLSRAQVGNIEEALLCDTVIQRDIDACVSAADSYERAIGFENKLHGRFLREDEQESDEKASNPFGLHVKHSIDHQEGAFFGDKKTSNSVSLTNNEKKMEVRRSSKADCTNPHSSRSPIESTNSVSLSLEPFDEQRSSPPGHGSRTSSNISDKKPSKGVFGLMEPPEIKFKFVKKILPKYVGHTREKLLAHDFVATILKNKMLSTQDTAVIQVRVADVSNDSSSVQVLVKGRSDLVDTVTEIFYQIVTREYITHNIRLLLSDERSLVVNVKLDITKDFGIQTTTPKQTDDIEGVWVEKVIPNRQMHKIFATGLDTGGVITRISKFGSNTFFSINKTSQITDFIKEAKSKFEKSCGDTKDKWAVMRICIPNDAYLGALDLSMVVLQNNYTTFYHRDGTPYTGKWTRLFKNKKVTSGSIAKTASAQTQLIPKEKGGDTDISNTLLLSTSVEHDHQVSRKVSKPSIKRTPLYRASDIVRMAENKLDDNSKKPVGYKLPLKGERSFSKRIESKKPNNLKHLHSAKMRLRREIKSLGSSLYQISFKPSSGPLGFFCTDVSSPTKDQVGRCMITSIDPNGIARKKSDKIRVGSTIESCGTTGCKEIIKSCYDIRMKYEALKTSNGNLVFTFRNCPTNSPRNYAHFDDKWTGTGAWAGAIENGWPGGAASTKKSHTERERFERKHEAEELQRARIRDAVTRKIAKKPLSVRNSLLKRPGCHT